jgi:hypothetical protein
MTERKLRCFVAMAVDRPETDRIYDRCIAPTLRTAGIQPVFMGRLEHNDDIDKRIINEIKQCDFAIADLTYARPSVYFEAGYAQRVVPVVYTCRANHLRPQADDEFGNFRVHFDLLMRNIIPWTEPGPTFSRRLAKRIRKVVAPMLRQRQVAEAARAEELQFHRLSVVARIEKVSEIFRKALQRFGYVPLVREDESILWVGRIPSRQTLKIVVLATQPNHTQRDIRECAKYLFGTLHSRFESFDDRESSRRLWEIRWRGHNLPNPIEVRHVTSIVARLVLCSLERIPRGRVAGALPSYTADENGQVLSLSTSVKNVGYQKSLPASVSVCVMDGIKSTSSAIEKSQELTTMLH